MVSEPSGALCHTAAADLAPPTDPFLPTLSGSQLSPREACALASFLFATEWGPPRPPQHWVGQFELGRAGLGTVAMQTS